MKQKIQIIAAPSILGLKPTGVEQMADTLLKKGLSDTLQLNTPMIELPTLNEKYSGVRDKKTKCLNPQTICSFSGSMMKLIEEQVNKNIFPLVLGGDCSILIGVMAGLKKSGNYGLIFLDAHADFYQPFQSPTGEVADMDLAIVTGRGPEILTDIDHLKPYVKEEHVIHLGQRDAKEAAKYGCHDIKETKMSVFDFDNIKSRGINEVINEVILKMKRLHLDGFWVHFDTDVIDDNENPAVDYRVPGGISFMDMKHLLHILVQTGMISGMSVTIFNPKLVKSDEIAWKISDCITFALDQNGLQQLARKA